MTAKFLSQTGPTMRNPLSHPTLNTFLLFFHNTFLFKEKYIESCPQAHKIQVNIQTDTMPCNVASMYDHKNICGVKTPKRCKKPFTKPETETKLKTKIK